MSARIAAVTMARNAGDFLRKWVSWYGAQLGEANLYIFLDGEDQEVPPFTRECHVKVVQRVEGNVAESDRGRIRVLSGFAEGLLSDYDFVIGTDVDEFITPDPATGLGLAEFISAIQPKGRKCFSPLGCDVVQNVSCEAPLDWTRPILEQRSQAFLSTRYTKASILCAPARWGSGFHRVRGSNFHIVKDLYLFHFGGADAVSLQERISGSDLSSRGWGRHFGKRSRLFRLAARLPVRSWGKWVPVARRLQTLLRPPYAWNKPAMLGLRIIVRIPERFRNLF